MGQFRALQTGRKVKKFREFNKILQKLADFPGLVMTHQTTPQLSISNGKIFLLTSHIQGRVSFTYQFNNHDASYISYEFIISG